MTPNLLFPSILNTAIPTSVEESFILTESICRLSAVSKSNAYIGPPHSQTPSKCPNPPIHHRNLPLSNLHRLRHCFQRPHQSASPGPTRFLLLPNPLLPDSQTPRTRSSLWTVQVGALGRIVECVRAVLPLLCGALDAVSADLAGDEG